MKLILEQTDLDTAARVGMEQAVKRILNNPAQLERMIGERLMEILEIRVDKLFKEKGDLILSRAIENSKLPKDEVKYKVLVEIHEQVKEVLDFEEGNKKTIISLLQRAGYNVKE